MSSLTKRETSMLISSAYKIHCSNKEKSIRHHKNRIGFKRWLRDKGYKATSVNYHIYKKSEHYLRTLSLDDFSKKLLSTLPEIDLSNDMV